jgi:hypothetical protein
MSEAKSGGGASQTRWLLFVITVPRSRSARPGYRTGRWRVRRHLRQAARPLPTRKNCGPRDHPRAARAGSLHAVAAVPRMRSMGFASRSTHTTRAQADAIPRLAISGIGLSADIVQAAVNGCLLVQAAEKSAANSNHPYFAWGCFRCFASGHLRSTASGTLTQKPSPERERAECRSSDDKCPQVFFSMGQTLFSSGMKASVAGIVATRL